MTKISSFALIGAFIFVLAPQDASARSIHTYWNQQGDITYGAHPWDVKPRRYYENSKINPYYYPKAYFYLHPDRAKSFALHPYHRDNYYTGAVDPDWARYSKQRQGDARYSEEYAYVPRIDALASCAEYSFQRPNYRIPPYNYYCK